VLAGVDEIPALLIGGGTGMLWLCVSRRSDHSRTGPSAALLIPPLSNQTGAAVVAGASGAAAVSLWQLGFFFLKVGAVLYGSGYVLVAFLQGGLVEQWGWITQTQLLDAIAIGQFTPGPVLSTATFVGFVIDGPAGAAVATLGIFLPSFLFVLILNPVIPRLRESPLMSCFLDAVNVSAVALMLAVTIELGVRSLVTWETALIAAVAAFLALRVRLNAAWIVLAGAVMGTALGLLPF
jgi:chromate transporter